MQLIGTERIRGRLGGSSERTDLAVLAVSASPGVDWTRWQEKGFKQKETTFFQGNGHFLGWSVCL